MTKDHTQFNLNESEKILLKLKNKEKVNKKVICSNIIHLRFLLLQDKYKHLEQEVEHLFTLSIN